MNSQTSRKGLEETLAVPIGNHEPNHLSSGAHDKIFKSALITFATHIGRMQDTIDMLVNNIAVLEKTITNNNAVLTELCKLVGKVDEQVGDNIQNYGNEQDGGDIQNYGNGQYTEQVGGDTQNYDVAQVDDVQYNERVDDVQYTTEESDDHDQPVYVPVGDSPTAVEVSEQFTVVIVPPSAGELPSVVESVSAGEPPSVVELATVDEPPSAAESASAAEHVEATELMSQVTTDSLTIDQPIVSESNNDAHKRGRKSKKNKLLN